jgi:hypothetical protein
MERAAAALLCGVPSTTPVVTIAGVGALTLTRVANAAGAADDPAVDNSTWVAFRPSVLDADPDIARLIALEVGPGRYAFHGPLPAKSTHTLSADLNGTYDKTATCAKPYLEEASDDPDDDDGNANTTAAADLNPCDVGVVVLWLASFSDAAGFPITTSTAAVEVGRCSLHR